MTTPRVPPTRTEAQSGAELIAAEVIVERQAQDAKWGEQNHGDFMPGSGSMLKHYAQQAEYWKGVNANRVAMLNRQGFPSDRNAAWDGILLEEVYEALAEADPAAIRAELIQVAAVACAWAEAIDRRGEVSR